MKCYLLYKYNQPFPTVATFALAWCSEIPDDFECSQYLFLILGHHPSWQGTYVLSSLYVVPDIVFSTAQIFATNPAHIWKERNTIYINFKSFKPSQMSDYLSLWPPAKCESYDNKQSENNKKKWCRNLKSSKSISIMSMNNMGMCNVTLLALYCCYMGSMRQFLPLMILGVLQYLQLTVFSFLLHSCRL